MDTRSLDLDFHIRLRSQQQRNTAPTARGFARWGGHDAYFSSVDETLNLFRD